MQVASTIRQIKIYKSLANFRMQPVYFYIWQIALQI